MLEGHLPRVIYHQVYNVYEDKEEDLPCELTFCERAQSDHARILEVLRQKSISPEAQGVDFCVKQYTAFGKPFRTSNSLAWELTRIGTDMSSSLVCCQSNMFYYSPTDYPGIGPPQQTLEPLADFLRKSVTFCVKIRDVLELTFCGRAQSELTRIGTEMSPSLFFCQSNTFDFWRIHEFLPRSGRVVVQIIERLCFARSLPPPHTRNPKP
jgi:hypothetical protein